MNSHTPAFPEDDSLDIDLFVDDLESEELPQADSLATLGSFSCAACASCPVGSASSASCIGSAG